MLGLIQRVSFAEVKVNDKSIAQIGKGMLVLLGVEKQDTESQAEHLAKRILAYRIFPDKEGKMNLSLEEINGELLVVPQFTLAAETHKGLRPGFSSAASPFQANSLFDHFVQSAKQSGIKVLSGEFGAYMQVSLCNDGPVTFLLRSS